MKVYSNIQIERNVILKIKKYMKEIYDSDFDYYIVNHYTNVEDMLHGLINHHNIKLAELIQWATEYDSPDEYIDRLVDTLNFGENGDWSIIEVDGEYYEVVI